MKPSYTPSYTQIQPMLAKDVDINHIKGDIIVQPKLDGIRAIWDSATQQLHTRSGKVITSCDHIIQQLYALKMDCCDLDGEIFTTELPFETINGLVRKQQPQADTLKLQFHVFDIINRYPARERAIWVTAIEPNKIIKPVATFFTTHKTIQQYYQCFLDSDLEGMILRDPKGYYQSGKADALYRVKPVHDTEAALVGFEPSTTAKNSKTFGSLVLQLPNGKKFKCSGLSDKQRNHLWQTKPLGASITIFFKGYTKNGLPREPRFKTIRTDLIGAVA